MREHPKHTHDFAFRHADNERRTWFVVALTGIVMVVELVAGYSTGSMALTADGWHMASHFGALGLAAITYVYARKNRHAEKFTFGAGKIYALSGYTNALLLAIVAVAMFVESIERILQPLEVDFLTALPVAVIGLVVNLVSARILHTGHRKQVDQNISAAYLHVLADALTSVAAIFALLAGHYLDWRAIDPLMGILGALLILRWAIGLCRTAAKQLLDVVPSQKKRTQICQAIEAIDDCRVTDLHLWEIAPDRLGCIISLSTATPSHVSRYREAVYRVAEVSHLTIEVVPAPTTAS